MIIKYEKKHSFLKLILILIGLIIFGSSIFLYGIIVGLKRTSVYTAIVVSEEIPDDLVLDYLEESGIQLDDYSKRILQYITELSPNDIKSNDLLDSIHRGLAASAGDPYTIYYTEKEYRIMNSLYSEPGGIGVTATMSENNSRVYITDIEPGGAAEKVGIQVGDIIKSVDGTDVVDMTNLQEAILKLRGKVGTQVTVEVDRNGEILTYNIKREKIELAKLDNEKLNDNTYYIRYPAFNGSYTDSFDELMHDLEDEGIENIILDLRNNSGGEVEQVGALAKYFTDSESILGKIEGSKEWTQYDIYADDYTGKRFNLVALVDTTSASASEMLAGALRDLENVKLVGERTFGKGVAQIIVPFEEGGALRVTIGQYSLPKGEHIHGVGLIPDYIIPTNNDFDTDEYNIKTDEAVIKALEILENEG